MTTTRGLRSRLARALPFLGGREDRGSRGAAELSVVVVAGSLVAGVFFGQGLSTTAVDLADGLTWLSDDPSGEIIQVNPATGDLEVRKLVGAPGEDLDVTQHDGQLFVTNHSTGQLMSFDLTSILVSGQRRVSTGGVVDTLMHDGSVFLVDSEQSTISAIDPVRTDVLGTIWIAPAGLADATIDDTGTVWALEDDGALHSLRWNDDTQEFDELDVTDVDLSGPGSVLVAHDTGVTVFGPDQGIVAQEGTGQVVQADSPMLSGDLLAPEHAPADLVPVAAPDTSFVVIASPSGIREVDMSTVACTDPGTPEVFRDTVYVPCRGEGKVVRLDARGQRIDRDLLTPGADDPELVLDDDTLIINAPGARQGVVVHGDGKVTSVVRNDPDVPVTTPASTQTPPVATPPDLIEDLLGQDEPEDRGDRDRDDADEPDDGDQVQTDGPGAGDGQPGDGNGGRDDGKGDKDGDKDGGKNGNSDGDEDPLPEEAAPINAPTGVTARVLAQGQVEVNWTHDSNPRADQFVIRSTDGVDYATVGADVRQAVISVTPGEPTALTVSAVLKGKEAESLPTLPVTTTARPGMPEVAGTAVYQGNGRIERFTVTITWGEAAANGSPVTSYDVSARTVDGTQTREVAGSDRSESFSWTCDQVEDPSCTVGGDVSVSVVATNSLGGGQAGTTTVVAPAQPPPPLPAADQRIVDGASPKSTSATVEGQGSITLRLRPPADWARFPGDCAYQVTGVQAGTESGVVDCDARTVDVAFMNGYIYDPEPGTRTHTVTFTATNARGTVTSAGYDFTSTQPTICQGCELP